MAGHNRWSKVRNVKGPRDAERSRLFQRLGQMLRAAAREGGSDPSRNAALAQVVEQCRARNMPKANIEAALRSAERQGGGSRVLLEARGPGGSAVLLELLTDNPRRAQHEIRALLARNGGSLCEGSRHGFEPTGVVRVSPRDGRGRAVSMEAALRRRWRPEPRTSLQFVCAPSSLRSVREGLEAAGLRPLSAGLEYVPVAPVALPEGPRAQAEQLLQALGDHPDVVQLYHNIL
ncbi:translational activator of cytochrome c oxidase 1 [Myiozetetes cayanensis]|uniref:translational activator of cytochrome c oxidase 1 n=1 Tax=Myiozetetes cayanensis TaxID=478635 RepID=UPI002160DF72|nr:translational activator of cytochrome c oxidase 1 [Myiozetetes cayanensis]